MKYLILIIALIGLSACGNGVRVLKEGDLRLGESFIVGLIGDCDTSNATKINGTCSFLTNADLGGITGKRNIPVSFELDPGGSLTMQAYGNQQTGAMEIRFDRLANDELGVRIGMLGNVIEDYSANFEGTDASARLTFFVDIHNNENPVHVLIWSEASGFAPTDAIVDSTVPGSPWFGRASGDQLSYRLENATLFASPMPGAPKYDH